MTTDRITVYVLISCRRSRRWCSGCRSLSKKTALKTSRSWSRRLPRKTRCADKFEQSRGALSKNLIRPLSYRITKASGSGDLLSRPPVHTGKRDGVDYGGGASREDGKTLDWFGVIRCRRRARFYIERLKSPIQDTVWTKPTSRMFGSVTNRP